MANVVIAVRPHLSHYLPMLKIAHDLRDHGHRVAFVSIEESQRSLVESYGFEFHRIPIADLATQTPRLWEKFPYAGILLRIRRYIRDMERDLSGDAVPRFLRAFEPSLALIESSLALFALIAQSSGIPVVSWSPFLQTRPSRQSPPLDSSLIPDGSDKRALEIENAWARYFSKRDRTEAFLSILGLSQLSLNRRVASRRGLDYDSMVDRRRFHFDVFRGPEFVLCPAEFDFPQDANSSTHYCGPGVFERRIEAEFAVEFVSGAEPMVYCALGSIFGSRKEHRRALTKLIDTFRCRPDLRLLAATGPHFDRGALGALPENIQVVEHAPQLLALRHAAVFLTHAGFGSVRESILAGVPMIALPLAADHPGIAARIVYHGLGLRMKLEDAHGDRLLAAVDNVLGDPAFKENVGRMQKIFVDRETQSSAAAMIERMLPAESISRSGRG